MRDLLDRLLSLLCPPRPVKVKSAETEVIDAGSWYRLGQMTHGQGGLVTGVRARVTT